MAKLNIITNEEANKVRYDSIQSGEIFIYDCLPGDRRPCIKVKNTGTAIELKTGEEWSLSGELLVTYVQSAKLCLEY